MIAPTIVLTCAHNVYSRPTNQKTTDLKFTPGINGNKGSRSVKVKKSHFPVEYQTLVDRYSEYDFAVLELEGELEKMHGYVGIDTREENCKEVKEI